MTKELRQQIYNKYEGHCAYCGCEIGYKDMQVDHIKPIIRLPYSKIIEHPENDVFDNMICSCRSCNIYKGSESIENFRLRIEDQPRQLLRQPMVNLAIRYGLLELKPQKITFHFER